MDNHDLSRAARLGEPSYVWRAGQERRLRMILEAAEGRERGLVLDVGCGLGAYLERLRRSAGLALGLEFDRQRACEAGRRVPGIVCGAAEHLPYPAGSFDLVLSHEVLEHVADDRGSVAEIVRVLKPGGRLVLFVPNRGYPFETHGIYWRGHYRFGNIPFVNYLPRRLRDRLAPHVRAYSARQLQALFAGLPVRVVKKGIIFGAYDNVIARWPKMGQALRRLLQSLESTPLRAFGLSHVWVVEKKTHEPVARSTVSRFPVRADALAPAATHPPQPEDNCMSNHSLPRRSFLKMAGLAAGASAPAACSLNSPPPREPVLRLAHLTDMHVLPYAGAMEGFALALRSLRALQPPVDVVINTGDCIMDALTTSKEDALAQWQAFRQVLERECALPIYHCVGNHDVWGWGLDDARLQSDPLYGKGMALAQLGLAQRYYSFDLGGWHFIVLDSTHPRLSPESSEPYIGLLDREQFDWLVADLAHTPGATPVCLVSHIPILAACELFDGPNECRDHQCNNSLYEENYADSWTLPGAWVHIDARRMRQLFLQHRNVRLCLSGHAHQVERLEYLGVTYLCNGAVSGNWWRGPYMDSPPGYVVVTLHPDGAAEEQFVAYAET